MGIFKKSAPADPLDVTMTGVKLGDRVLAMGLREPAFVARIAAKAGLTGRACVVDADAARLKIAAAAIEREGALVEAAHAAWGVLPFDDDSFDIAVVRDLFGSLSPISRELAALSLHRVLRPGGRVIVIEAAPRGGMIGAILNRQASDPEYQASGGAAAALAQAGFAAVRQLAEHEGQLFIEGIRKA